MAFNWDKTGTFSSEFFDKSYTKVHKKSLNASTILKNLQKFYLKKVKLKRDKI